MDLPSYQDVKGTPPTVVFASMSMHEGDRLRLMGFGLDEQAVVRDAISRHWTHGLQSEREYHGSHEFKLHKYPWYPTVIKGDDSMVSRRLMSKLLEALFNMGWVLNISTAVSKTTTALDTLIFSRQTPTSALQHRDWMCIAFSNGDRLRFIDAPPDLLESAKQMLTRIEYLQSHQEHGSDGCYEFKLHGYPWNAMGGETMRVRQMLLELMGILNQHGWTVYGSIDQKAQVASDSAATKVPDTWHCCRT